MRKLIKLTAMLLALFILIGATMAGCSKKGKDATDGKETVQESTNKSTSNEPADKPEERIKMKMFMSDSGLAHPEGIDPSDNEFINIVEDYANVDLEIEIPGITEFQTRFTLLLNSGDLPDIVHTSICNDANRAAENGAFIDVKEYYDNSVNVKKWITPEMMDMASYNGKYYRVPMSGASEPQGYYTYIRYELVEKYNNGVIPDTVEGWIELLKKMKAQNPDSVPLSGYTAGNSILYQGQSFFQWYGARINEYRVQNGKVVSTFTLPEYREAVLVMKDLYEAGVLDKEFATRDYANRWDIYFNREGILNEDAASQILPIAAYWATTEEYKDLKPMYAKPLSKYPEVVADPKYTYGKKSAPIIYHGVYISSSCKNPERAWRVIEGFASDELYEAIFWGKEGSEYVVKDGKRIPDAAKLLDPQRYWSLHLALIFGFSAGQDSKLAQQEQVLGTEYFKQVHESVKAIEAQAEEAGVSLFAFMPQIESVQAKLAESENFISNATAQAIMGQITMEEFDKKVEEFKVKYGFIGEEYTKWMNENKDKLRSWGVKEVDW